MKRLGLIVPVLAGFAAGVAFVYSCGGGSSSDAATMEQLEARVEQLEALLANAVLSTADINGLSGPHLIFSGINVHLRNGSGQTNTANGLGNLVIGYNEGTLVSDTNRTGSHNLVVGPEHRFPSFGGLVSGYMNMTAGQYATVGGGYNNYAEGTYSSINGGHSNSYLSTYQSDRTPSYDSGWQPVAQGSYIQLNHNLGGLVDDYRVELLFKDNSGYLNHFNYGKETMDAGTGGYWEWGAWWSSLDTTRIRVYRANNDQYAPYVRVLIWKNT